MTRDNKRLGFFTLAAIAVAVLLFIIKGCPWPVPDDTEPPQPNPAQWAGDLTSTGTTISMTATVAVDESGVEYQFVTADGHSSEWQSASTYTDRGLTLNTKYTYRVQYRDRSEAQNVGDYSEAASATTGETPGPIADAVEAWVAELVEGDPVKVKMEAGKLAMNYRMVAGKIGDLEIVYRKDAVAAVKTANQNVLGDRKEAWGPFFAALAALLDSKEAMNELATVFDVQVAFEQIATGLEAAAETEGATP